MTNLGKLVTSKRFWLIVVTFSLNGVNSIKPFVSPKWMAIIDAAAAVLGVILTIVSPTTASEAEK